MQRSFQCARSSVSNFSTAATVQVLKFGGTSVGSPPAFQSSGAIISAPSPHRTVSVLSAMHGVTNRLLEASRVATAGDRAGAVKLLNELLDFHVRTARALCAPAAAAACADGLSADASTVRAALGTLADAADAVSSVGAGERVKGHYAADAVACAGEQWSARIMATHLVERGFDAEFVSAADVIVTDGVAGNARPLLELTRTRALARLRPLLDRGALPIVTGFFGAGRDGRLTTLGRGGSDLSAAVIGSVLDASTIKLFKVELENSPDGVAAAWVAGWVGVVHDADSSATIPQLHYEEARELAHFAKKVLHPETVSPAIEKGIPISVLNTLDTQHPGTNISAEGAAAGAGGGRVLTVTHQPLAAYEAKHRAAGHGVDDDVLVQLRLSSRDQAALVALVGFGVMRMEGLAERALAALVAAGVPAAVPKHVNGSQHSLSIVVPLVQRKNALNILHKAFVK